jgi:hypothetical protein
MRVIKKQSFSDRDQCPIGSVKKNIRANIILCLNPFLFEGLQRVFRLAKPPKESVSLMHSQMLNLYPYSSISTEDYRP